MSRFLLFCLLLLAAAAVTGCYQGYYAEYVPPPAAVVVPAPVYVSPHVHGPGCGHYYYDGYWYDGPVYQRVEYYDPDPYYYYGPYDHCH